jgi:hypothetical protein
LFIFLMEEQESPRKLPEFEGYTVDFKLRQFRKVSYDPLEIIFIDFDTQEGRELMDKYEEYLWFFEP